MLFAFGHTKIAMHTFRRMEVSDVGGVCPYQRPQSRPQVQGSNILLGWNLPQKTAEKLAEVETENQENLVLKNKYMNRPN